MTKPTEVHRTCSTCAGFGVHNGEECPMCEGKLYTVHFREDAQPTPGTLTHPKFEWTNSASTNIRERFAKRRRELGIPEPAR